MGGKKWSRFLYGFSRSSFSVCSTIRGMTREGLTLTRHAAQLALSFFFGLCLALHPSTARAEVYAPSDAAFQVYKQIMQEAVSTGMANMELLWDLSWRWYNADPSKRDKVPVDAVNGAEPLNHFQNWGDFYAWVKSQGYYFYYPYNLVGFDDGKYWDSSSPNADLEYAKWYDWFEGVSSGSSTPGNTENGDYVRIAMQKSFQDDNTLVARVVIDNSYYNYGPIPYSSAYQDAPQYVYVDVPKSMVESMPSGYTVLRVYLRSGYVNLCADASTYSPYDWQEVSISRNDTTYEVEQLRYAANGNAYSTTYGYQDYEYQDGVITLVGTKSWYKGNNSYNTQIADFYSAVSLFEGTYTPPDEPVVPTDPVYRDPDPTPTPVIPIAPTLPTNGIVSNPVVNDLEDFQNWLDQALATYFGDVINWLKYIAEWEETISGQIYDFEENALELWQETNQWLKGIFYKRSGSGGNTGIDPVTNPDEGFTWWQKLLEWLGGLLPEGLTDLISLVSTLNRHFPFSIPWDVGFIIGMLAETPTTPEFDIRFYYPNFNLDWTWHVDLTPFDTVAYIFRSAVTVWFAMVLMTWTPDVIKQTTSIV